MNDWSFTARATSCSSAFASNAVSGLQIVAQAIAIDLHEAGQRGKTQVEIEMLVSDGVPPGVACELPVERWVIVLRASVGDCQGRFVLASFAQPEVALAYAEFAEVFFERVVDEASGGGGQPPPPVPPPTRSGPMDPNLN